MHFFVLLQHSHERNNVRKNMLYNKQLKYVVKNSTTAIKKKNILRFCKFMVLTVMPANNITTKGPTRPD
jgi:hypothetical protein